MFLFSGIFFPVGNLPGWAQTFAWFLPLTHGVSASRALFAGKVEWVIAGDLLWLFAFFTIAFFIAVRSIRKRLIL
jgi:lipooligosaccharide transport system permease protein